MSRSCSPADPLSRRHILVFDLDGVLIDSNRMRDAAFVHIFATIGCEDSRQVLAIHRNNRGLFRKNKLSLIYEHFFGSPPAPELLDRLTESFAQYVRKHLSSCPLTPGVREFLEAYAGREMFVVSAAEHEEVLWVTETTGLARFFRGIYGGPTPKTEWLRRICAAQACQPSEAMFVGDQISDYRAAQEVGVNFVGLVAAQEQHAFPPAVLCVHSFPDLSLLLTDYPGRWSSNPEGRKT